MPSSLQDKTILVTGATNGIGLGIKAHWGAAGGGGADRSRGEKTSTEA